MPRFLIRSEGSHRVLSVRYYIQRSSIYEHKLCTLSAPHTAEVSPRQREERGTFFFFIPLGFSKTLGLQRYTEEGGLGGRRGHGGQGDRQTEGVRGANRTAIGI